MSEITIAEPLSGAEVIDSILEKVRETLMRDCYLNPASAYESYSADIHVAVRLKDCGREPVVVSEVHVESETPVDEDAALTESDAQLYDAPPNEVRQDAGLPIPTLVEDSQGRKEVKRVRYGRKVAAAAE